MEVGDILVVEIWQQVDPSYNRVPGVSSGTCFGSYHRENKYLQRNKKKYSSGEQTFCQNPICLNCMTHREKNDLQRNK